LPKTGTNAKFYQIGSGGGSAFGKMLMDRSASVWMEMAINKRISGATGNLKKELDG